MQIRLTLAPIAAATLLAVSLPASAADIQLFGFLDQGLSYLHESLNSGMAGPNGQGRAKTGVIGADGRVARNGTRSTLSEGTGNVSTWGMKGGEDLGQGWKVRFHLESGFLPDDGTIYRGKNEIFERESTLGLDTPYGQIKFGRMPALTTGSGTTGIFNSRVNPFGAGWGNMTGGWKFSGTLAMARHDNMINYVSPSFGGFKGYAQYSFKNDKDSLTDNEGTSRADRWWAVGASMQGEKYFVAAALDCVNTATGSERHQKRDSYKALIGGHYNFDAFKLYATAQYLKNVAWIGGYSTKEFAPYSYEQSRAGKANPANQKGFDAWAVSLGTDFKAFGGTVKASVAYADGENQNADRGNKFKRANAGLGYIYPLSKRTSLYAIGGYFWEESDWQQGHISAHEVVVGMMHRF